jgi:DNA-binding MarR family transcriptional regulator
MDENEKIPIYQKFILTYWVCKHAYELGLGANVFEAWGTALIAKLKTPTQNELVNALPIDASLITRYLKDMEQNGLVKRERDPADNRLVRVSLTEKGQEVAQIYAEKLAYLEKKIFDGLTPQEQATLYTALSKMQTNAQNLRQEFALNK